MTAYLRRHGVGLEAIGLFAASLYAPWGFKWAWAPLVDLVRSERFGPSRAWIVFAQTMMILTIGVVLFFDPATQLGLVTLVDHRAQRVRGDAGHRDRRARRPGAAGERDGHRQRAHVLGRVRRAGDRRQRRAVRRRQARIRRRVPVHARRAHRAAVRGLAAAARAGVGGPGPRHRVVRRRATGVGREAFARLRHFLVDLYESFFRSGRGPLLGVLFAILPQGAVALGLALGTTIPVDLGMSEEQIAGLSLLTSLARRAGSVAGGWVSDRVGHRKSLAVWYALTALPPLFLAWRMWGAGGVAGIDARLYTIVAACFSVASGLQYGTGNAVLMSLSSRAVAATQFTGYMALKNLALTYSNLWQGRMASTQGYARTLLIDGIGAVAPHPGPAVPAPAPAPGRRAGSGGRPAPAG